MDAAPAAAAAPGAGAAAAAAYVALPSHIARAGVAAGGGDAGAGAACLRESDAAAALSRDREIEAVLEAVEQDGRAGAAAEAAEAPRAPLPPAPRAAGERAESFTSADIARVTEEIARARAGGGSHMPRVLSSSSVPTFSLPETPLGSASFIAVAGALRAAADGGGGRAGARSASPAVPVGSLNSAGWRHEAAMGAGGMGGIHDYFSGGGWGAAEDGVGRDEAPYEAPPFNREEFLRLDSAAAGRPPRWQRDADARACAGCAVAFGMFIRRHVCAAARASAPAPLTWARAAARSTAAHAASYSAHRARRSPLL